jgi:hypothetical protein
MGAKGDCQPRAMAEGPTDRNGPVSQICAFTVLSSTLTDRVANSTPIVDLVSRLNSLRVNRPSTVGGERARSGTMSMEHDQRQQSTIRTVTSRHDEVEKKQENQPPGRPTERESSSASSSCHPPTATPVTIPRPKRAPRNGSAA